MKWFFLIWILFAASVCCSSLANAQSERQRLRIMSYNTHHSEGMDGKLDLERLARVITSQGPTLVALQELDSVTERANRVFQLEKIAKLTNMNGVFAKAIPYGGGSYGNGILSKETPLSVKSTPVPGAERRLLLMAEFENYVFACTHLDGSEAYLDSAYAIIRREAVQWKKPFIIAGDWNCRPDNKFIKNLKKDFIIITDENSVPYDEPTYCIDYIAALDRYATFDVVRKWVIKGSVSSDHCPTCATVDMKPRATGLGDVQGKRNSLSVEDNRIEFPDADANGRVVIFTTDGKKVYDGIPKPVSVERGNYVILLENETVKVRVN